MKKLLIKLFAIAMVFSLSPIDVHAVETENDTNPIQVLYVGDVDAIENPSGDGWTFDAEEGVLTLNNANIKGSTIHNHYDYNYDAAIYVEGDLTIELIGDNYVERQVTTAPTSDSMYYAICSAVYPYEGYDEPSKLKIVGSGKLTAGVEFVEEAIEWEYLYYSCGIFSNSYGGVDLTGLQKGSELYVYGGFAGEADYYQIAGAWNTSPTFGDNQIVIAYMDIEGTMENEAGYNWNNNDACLMKVLVTDAYLNSYGLLTLNDNGSASGNGWTWNNNVLTLSENCGVNAVWFKSSLNSSKLVLNGDVTLNSVGVPNGYDYADSIYTQTPLEIDTGEYTLTLTSERYGIYAENDVLISGGTVSVEDYEEDYNDMYAIYAKGADVTIQNATLNADNELYLEERYIEESDSYVSPGLLKIENSVFNSILGISSWGSVKIDSSDVTISNCFIGISADGDMELTNSTINITADLYSDSMVFNSGGSGIVVIDNCNLNVTALGDVLYMYTRNMTPDFTRVSITNTAITTPEVWSVGTQLRGSSDYITLLDTDGNVVKTLIGTASLVPHEHAFGEWKDAEDGLTHVRECECEETETENHAYGDGVITTEATHTAKGVMTYTCTGCGYTYTEDIPETAEHAYGEWTVDENGTTHSRVCECEEKETANHEYDEGQITTNPTHLTKGVKTYTCEVCGHTYTEEVPTTTEHTFGNWVEKNETTHERECECGEKETANHTYDDGIVTKEATHTEKGVMTYTCTGCGYTYTEDIPETAEHAYGEWKDSEDGLTHVRECECEEKETANHTYDDGTVTKEASHTEKGVMTYTCADCGYSYTEDIPETEEHTYGGWVEKDAATHERTCECGEKETSEHTFGEWIKQDNKLIRECNECDANEEFTLDEEVNTTPDTNDGDTGLEDTDLDLIESILTEEEKEELANGAEVSIFVIAKDIFDVIMDDERMAIDDVRDNFNIGMILDIDLFKKVDGRETQVKETFEDVTIKITVPDHIINNNENYIRNYKMVRVHNNGSLETTLIDGVFNETDHSFTFKTNRFSTYALIYKDTATAGPTPTPEIIENNQPVQSQVPNTGDHQSVLLWALWMMTSGLAAALLYKKRIATK